VVRKLTAIRNSCTPKTVLRPFPGAALTGRPFSLQVPATLGASVGGLFYFKADDVRSPALSEHRGSVCGEQLDQNILARNGGFECDAGLFADCSKSPEIKQLSQGQCPEGQPKQC